jgi:peptidoglycan hydrolase-like protein with peptidoglycan-binding domain
MKTIESLQRWLKAKGFDPGPIDGLDGPPGTSDLLKQFRSRVSLHVHHRLKNETSPQSKATRRLKKICYSREVFEGSDDFPR